MLARSLEQPTIMLGLAILLYLSAAIFSINKPLTMDEAMPIAYNAAAIADFGFDAIGSAPHKYEISHPLLYQNLLALSFTVFGKTALAARLVGLLSFLTSLFLILQISRALFPNRNGNAIGGIAALLYAMNPFMIQFSLVVVPETTITPIAVLLFFLVFIRSAPLFNFPSILLLSSLLALCAWTKEYAPSFILVAIFIYLWVQVGFRHSFLIVTTIAFLGGFLFMATWSLYCLGTGVPIMSFIEFSILNKALNPDFHGIHGPLRGLITLLTTTGRWVTPAFLALLALAAFQRLALLREEQRVDPIDLLWIYVIVVWVAVNLYMFQPRYQFPLYAFATILIADYIRGEMRGIRSRDFVAVAFVGAALGIALTLLQEDPLLRDEERIASLPYAALVTSFNWKVTELIAYAIVWIAIPLALSVTVLVGLGAFAKRRKSLAVGGIFSVMIATCMALNIKQTASYTTAMNWGLTGYGETGLRETVDFLREKIDGSVPVIRKDIAYHLMQSGLGQDMDWIYTSIFRDDLDAPEKRAEIQSVLARDEVRYVVLDPRGNAESAVGVITPEFRLVQTFGDFQVFERETN